MTREQQLVEVMRRDLGLEPKVRSLVSYAGIDGDGPRRNIATSVSMRSYETVKKLAEMRGLNMSEYLRRIILMSIRDAGQI